MQMDQQALRELLEFLSSSDIQELKLEGDDFRLEVRRNMPAPQAVMLPAQAAPIAADVSAHFGRRLQPGINLSAERRQGP